MVLPKIVNWMPRSVCGGIQVICGLIEFTLGIAVLCLPLEWHGYLDVVGWGIWNGAFATITGFLGINSQRSKKVVNAYQFTSITSVIPSICCGIWAGFQVARAEPFWYYRYNSYQGGYVPYYRYYSTRYGAAHLIMYIILLIAFVIQTLVSLIGVCVSCSTSEVDEQNPQSNVNASTTGSGSQTSLSLRLTRGVCGCIQIICGAIEVALGIAVMEIKLGWPDESDQVGFGIWNGALAIVVGILSLSRLRRTCTICTYNILSTLSVIASFGCCLWAGFSRRGAIWLAFYRRTGGDGRYNDYRYAEFHIAVYTSLCATFAVQMLMSIIAGCFTCCSSSNRSQSQLQAHYYSSNPSQSGHDPPSRDCDIPPTHNSDLPPPYIVVVGKPSKTNLPG